MPQVKCSSKDGIITHTLEIEPSTTLLDLRYQLCSLTNTPHDQIFLHINSNPRAPNDDHNAATTFSDLSSIPTHLNYEQLYPEATIATQPQPPTPANVSKQPEHICTNDLQAALSSLKALSLAEKDEKTKKFCQRVRSYYNAFIKYKGPELNAKALAVLPLALLEEQARVRVGTESRYRTYERALVKEMLHWFKNSFFSWMDVPSCCVCDGGEMKFQEMVVPLERELQFGANRVEQFVCANCGAMARFPRYNDPGKLLETRKGRCGEYANAFTFLLRAVGIEARKVYDWTDHVWTEAYCKEGDYGMWVHADSCEDLLDEPLVYEKGWGKKLTYCVAVGKDCVMDVTRRYTADFNAILERRTLADEENLKVGLRRLNEEAMDRLSETEKLEARRRYERDEVQIGVTKTSQSELQGRQSGSRAWIQARGEDGTQK